MGRFIREQMEREGVSTEGIVTDGERLTALVILGVRDEDSFPLIFYRDNCADMALTRTISTRASSPRPARSWSPARISRAQNTAAAQKKAIRIAKANGRKVVFDVDYRPNLWGLLGHGAGESRYVRSDAVTEHLKPILADCDLDRRHGGRTAYRGRLGGYAHGHPRHPRDLQGDHRVQARPHGLRGVSWRDSRLAR